MRRTRVPIGAAVFSALGGLLIVLNGLLFVLFGTSTDTWALYGLGGTVEGIGFVAIFLGGLLLTATGVLVGMPDAHRGLGIMILTFSLLSLPVGGGFILGTLIGWIGGVAAIVARPERVPVGELDVDWVEVLDDPVVEADLHDAGVRLPPAGESAGRSP